MRLNRLEMYGFKSFANKVEIEFGDGITGIVGPNGSGKSNIADAIRWVLGEQNVRIIRGVRIEDVIFKGSKERRAAGAAEVVLNFDNDGDIPLDFKEISIQRRVFRTGESEFYINRSRCRLKDIIDLFSDTGIGLGGISMISQNRVDDILKAKPEERRVFFEETIGITKYRNRKHDTLHRIDDTETNLTRVVDIISELDTQLEPLTIQAELTNRYNALKTELRQLQLIEIQRKRQNLTAELEKQSESKAIANDKLVELQSKLSSEEVIKEKINNEVIDIEQEIYKQSEQNEQIRQQFESNVSEITKLTERQIQNRSTHDKLLQQQKKLSLDLESSTANLSSLKKNLQNQREELQNQQSLIKNVQKDSDKLEEELQNQDSERRNQERTISLLRQKLTTNQNEALIIEHDLAAFEESQQSHKKDKDSLITEINELRGENDVLQSRQESITKEVADMKNRRQELNSTLKLELQTNETLQMEQNKQSQQFRTMETKLQILQRMQENHDGFAKAPRAVLNSKASWSSKICGAVGELLSVPPKFATAIEIALGSSVQNVVTEDEDTAKAAIEYLKQERLGRVTFLPLSRIVASKALFEVNEVGVVGFASDLVKTSNKLRKIADFLLSKTLVVDSIDNALRIAKDYKVRIVTLEGEVLNIGGSISGGSSRQVESNIFNRSVEIEILTDELNDVRIKLNETREQREITESKLTTINDEINAINTRINALDVEVAENRIKIIQTQKSIKEKEMKLNNLRNSMSEQTEAIENLKSRKRSYTELIMALMSEIERADDKLKSSSSELSHVEMNYKTLVKKLKQMEIDCAVHEQEIIRTENQVELLQNKIASDESELRNVRIEERTLMKALSDSSIKLVKLKKENELTQSRLAYGQQQVKSMYSTKMEKLAKVSDIEKKLRELNRQLSSTKNQLHEIELTIRQLEILIADCENKISEITSLSIGEICRDSPLSDELIAKRIVEIETELSEIGAVNPNAPKEFAELKSRCDFLKRQLEDLETAKNNLQTLIVEIDSKIVSRFLIAFEQIQKLFSEVFIKLFGGGNAQLELTNKEDVLNSGVEIMVTLPQKKRQHLSMLSGGERALTVIALLFAFLKFRPSPFCILDEVDAPLDEANLLRFGTFLRDLSVNTQFILITHRKTTMEFLDRIYGITIEETGISRVLSVKLKS